MQGYKLFLFSITFLSYQFLFAQINIIDQFTDSNYTANPIWQGDSQKFIINSNKQLQLDDTSNNSPAHLVVASEVINNARWEFYVRMDFDPSASNLAKVYLVSSNEDLSAALDGYFVQIGGQSGTIDEVSLYRQNGTQSSKIIDGINGTVGLSPKLKVRVTKDSVANWELLIDTSASFTGYTSQGSAIDNNIANSKYFGVYCKYSSTRSDKFFFDDFLIQGMAFQDTVKPVLLDLELIDSLNLLLTFSENLDVISGENASNYMVDNGIGQISVAMIDAIDSFKVNLQLAVALTNGEDYNLSISNVEDRSGNSILNTNRGFTYLVPQTARYRDIVINELYPDFNPSNGLPNAEFIEIFNASNKVIDLANWEITDGTGTGILSSNILKPKEYLILCNQSHISDFSIYGNTLGLNTFPTLNNTGDKIQLFNPNQVLIDEVDYSIESYNDVSKDDGGWTLEQINPFTDCIGKHNFEASTATIGGSPGIVNSIFDSIPDQIPPIIINAEIISETEILLTFNELMDSVSLLNGTYTFNTTASVNQIINVPPAYNQARLLLGIPLDSGRIHTLSISGIQDCEGNLISASSNVELILPAQPKYRDVVINEIFSDFDPQIGLPRAEFIEVYNASNQIFDLNGWTIEDPSSTATLKSIIFHPGDFLIVTKAANESLFQSFGNVQGLSSFPTLNNGEDELELKNANGKTIDKVNYSIDWFKDLDKRAGGYTLEQINPFTECTGINNFSGSNNPNGGTPAQQNSLFDTIPDTSPPELLEVNVLSADSILLSFNERLDELSAINANYSFSSGATIGQVINLPPAFNQVLLLLSQTLDSGVINTLTVTNLTDCIGNLIGSNNSAELVIPGIPQFRDVVINEFLADQTPSVGLPEAEFIELFNASDQILNLEGWSLGDQTTRSILGNYIFRPGEFITICDIGNEEAFSALGPTQGQFRFAALNNGGDHLTLRDKSGRIIDDIIYTDQWYGDESRDGGGYSLEQINPFLPCTGMNNFRASKSNNGGTPGQINSNFSDAEDIQAPVLQDLFVLSKDTLLLNFSEGLDVQSLSTASYNFSTSTTIASVIPIPPSNSSIYLVLSTALDSGRIVELSVSDISDCSSNSIQIPQKATFALPELAKKEDIVVNEVLFNPRTAGSDFVEIYNRSNKIISLENWKLGNEEDGLVANLKDISNLPYLIFPGEYLALSVDIQNISREYPLAKLDRLFEMQSLPSYNDDEGTVFLTNANGNIIDRIIYEDDYHFDLLSNDEGVSLERIDPLGQSLDRDNFHSASEAVGFATPGYENSQFKRFQAFSGEVKVDPETFSPDNDGYQDLLFINYQFEKSGFVANVKIYDRYGRLSRELVNNELMGLEGRFSWDGITDNQERAKVGIYIVHFEVFNLDGEEESYKLPIVLASFLD